MKLKKILSCILFHPITKILIGLIVISAAYNLSNKLFNFFFNFDSLSKDLNKLIVSVISAIIVLVIYKLLYQFYEKRRVKEISKIRALRFICIGLVIGFFLQALTILLIYLGGGYTVLSINPISSIFIPFAMAFSAAIVEEVIFRGIIFRITEEKLGSYYGLIISALIFGGMHLGNPNSSITSALALAIQAGLLLGASYIYSRSLWFPIAIHFAWNFSQSAIFGAKVSGVEISKTLISSKIEGAHWLTGGQFGPEGSVQATVFALVTTMILMALAHKKGKAIKPVWKRR